MTYSIAKETGIPVDSIKRLGHHEKLLLCGYEEVAPMRMDPPKPEHLKKPMPTGGLKVKK